jgi:hypothetical protein
MKISINTIYESPIKIVYHTEKIIVAGRYLICINVVIVIKEYRYDELKHIFGICLLLIAPAIIDLLIINWTWSTYLERIHNNYISLFLPY